MKLWMANRFRSSMGKVAVATVGWVLAAPAPASAQTTGLDAALSVEIANRSETDYLFDVSDQAVDAGGVHWVGITGHAIQPAGLQPGCWVGGDIEGPYGEDSVYECKPVHCPDRVCPDPCLAFHTTAGASNGERQSPRSTTSRGIPAR